MIPLLPIFRIVPTPAMRFEPIRAITPMPGPHIASSAQVPFARRLQNMVLRSVSGADTNQTPS